jgi:hypothetical protein
MRLNAPTKIVFIISVVLAVMALLPMVGVAVPVVGGNTIWFALSAYAVLAAGNLFKGL